MVYKALVVCLVFIYYAHCTEFADTSINSHAFAAQKLENCQFAEKSIRIIDSRNTFHQVKVILEFCLENGMTHNQIAEKFECPKVMVQEFMAGVCFGSALVSAVHQYYVDSKPALSDIVLKAQRPNSWHNPGYLSDVFHWLPGVDGLKFTGKTLLEFFSTSSPIKSNAAYPRSETPSSEGEALVNDSLSSDGSVDALVSTEAHPPLSKTLNEGLRKRKPHSKD
ncbi:MAG: hypothetical protein Q8K36_02895, partial [Alphaproteobacteria bacterium]|nr:hypothetical protein [Alphaproteobacteria bacterium]